MSSVITLLRFITHFLLHSMIFSTMAGHGCLLINYLNNQKGLGPRLDGVKFTPLHCIDTFLLIILHCCRDAVDAFYSHSCKTDSNNYLKYLGCWWLILHASAKNIFVKKWQFLGKCNFSISNLVLQNFVCTYYWD